MSDPKPSPQRGRDKLAERLVRHTKLNSEEAHRRAARVAREAEKKKGGG